MWAGKYDALRALGGGDGGSNATSNGGNTARALAGVRPPSGAPPGAAELRAIAARFPGALREHQWTPPARIEQLAAEARAAAHKRPQTRAQWVRDDLGDATMWGVLHTLLRDLLECRKAGLWEPAATLAGGSSSAERAQAPLKASALWGADPEPIEAALGARPAPWNGARRWLQACSGLSASELNALIGTAERARR